MSTGSLLGYAAVEIDAPAERVWAALTDFAAYGEWNPFTPRVEAEARVGAKVTLHVDMGFRKFVERGEVVEVEPGRSIRWHVFPMPRALAWGNRVQRIEPLDGGRCRYTSEDRLNGALAPLVALFMRKKVSSGFAAAGAALKKRVESSG